ncbi:D-aminopeptidase [Kutzneria viridogrisea]|uniref:D-aminopeptidase n=1 Tax=Kutzneria viridogrisea TaxID=47990 RepID=A0ABR6BLW6_9PSEU|nr:D-aminopeptidase [Kutzneria viridogrisea]
MSGVRLRELGLDLPLDPCGPDNAITDVPGVRVGHTTLVSGHGPLVIGRGPVRTGVTVIKPRHGYERDSPVYAGAATLNGNGEFTGLEWVRESGLLTTPIAITNTHSVGTVRDALVRYDPEHATRTDYWSMPAVAETYDGVLNDINGMHVREEHVHAALRAAAGGPVAEGSVGGGTGMICHGFKGGIGTASRLAGPWTVGALVQANYGRREDLRVCGYPVGRLLGEDVVPLPGAALAPGSGSIIIVLATDAPLLADQCRRLAQRAFVGLARVGGGCADSSGDIALAFATGNEGLTPEYVTAAEQPISVRTLPHQALSPLFEAAAGATEEAILNALLAAETMTGAGGVTAHGLSTAVLIDALRRCSP